MSALLRFLGLRSGGGAQPEDETESVRRIAAHLERLEPEKARFLAAFSYVLARVADADLRTEDSEIGEMERRVRSLADLDEDEARLVVEISRSRVKHLGGTENYRVTKEFRRISTREERLRLLECLYAVAAADGTISTSESAEIVNVAVELGLTRQEANALRAQWKDKLAEFQGLASES